MKEMKTLTFPNGTQYEVIDAQARQDVSSLKESIVDETSSDTLTWDGNTAGLTHVAVMGDMYLVSEKIPTLEDCSGGAVVEFNAINGDLVGENQIELVATDMMGDGSLIIFEYNSMMIVIVVSESVVGVDIDGISFEKSGVYFMNSMLGETTQIVTTSLTINGYTGFTQTKIKEELLPESVNAIVYANLADFYIYKDVALTEKITKSELMALTVKKHLLVSLEGIVFFTPTMVGSIETDYATLEYPNGTTSVNGIDVMTKGTLYTSEYTGS